MPPRVLRLLVCPIVLLAAGCSSGSIECGPDDPDCRGGSDGSGEGTGGPGDGTVGETGTGTGLGTGSDDGGDPTDSGGGGDDTGGPPVNLLSDPGFEDDDGSWSIWGGAARVEGEARTGTWAVRATTTNGAEQRVRGLTPDTVYRLSGWARTDGSEPVSIGVKDYGGEELRVLFTDADYREDSFTFTTGFSDTEATIYVYKHSGDATAHADDLVLVEEGPSGRTPIWAEEFDGTGALDAARWTHEEGFVRNREVQWYQEDNAFQEGGLLVIEGRTENRPNPGYDPAASDWRAQRETIEYTSSSVTTRNSFSFQYGTLVVRAKVTNDTGTWPAIWTLGTNCEWPSSGEVDVMENYGGDILANFAWGTNTRWSAQWDSSRHPVADLGSGWAEDFHIWEFRWTESRMSIRLDGRLLNDVALSGTINGSAACAGENPFQQPHYILLNLALGANGGSVDGLSFPTRYLVDYVRVYAAE